MTNVPGKNIRSKMISIFQEWLDADKSITDTISEIVSILHNASLMYVCFLIHSLSTMLSRIDDIEDNSKLRRGVPGICFCSFPWCSHSFHLWHSIDHQLCQSRILYRPAESSRTEESPSCRDLYKRADSPSYWTSILSFIFTISRAKTSIGGTT